MRKTVIVPVTVFAAFFFLAGCGAFEKSGISNCVIVENEADFTGDYLKHSRFVLFERLPTAQCVKKDKEIDKGDGAKKGKVRWVECTKGPDCDEARMF
jgi:hypothetical protein